MKSYESKTYKKVIINNSYRKQWKNDIIEKNDFLLKNEIWKLIDLFKERIIFRDKWIYIIKREVRDEVTRFKIH